MNDYACNTRKHLVSRYGEALVARVEVLAGKAREYGICIATAESLTAGAIAHLIGSVAPDMLAQGNIVYNNDAKADLLGVNRDTLREYEAVSKPVALQMANGARKNAKLQVGVAVTGYAGQSGDEVRGILPGTVFISASCQKAGQADALSYVEELHFDGDRTSDIRKTILGAVTALEASVDASIENKQAIFFEGRPIASSIAENIRYDPMLPEMVGREPAEGGKPTDSALTARYGKETIANVHRFLTTAKQQGQTVAVVGGVDASEIAAMLTTLNGSSSVVTRGLIIPDKDQRLKYLSLPQKVDAEAMIRQSQCQPGGNARNYPTLVLAVDGETTSSEVTISLLRKIGENAKKGPELAPLITCKLSLQPDSSRTEQVAKQALNMLQHELAKSLDKHR